MLTQVNDGRDPWQILVPIAISAQTPTSARVAVIKAAGAMDNPARPSRNRMTARVNYERRNFGASYNFRICEALGNLRTPRRFRTLVEQDARFTLRDVFCNISLIGLKNGWKFR